VVADWLIAHPREAQVLTIEEATRRAIPNIVQRTKAVAKQPTPEPPTKSWSRASTSTV
jgi:hypothetical protein